MDYDLLNYYERELTFIRALGSEFAKEYPKIAGRLLLEPDKCEDPFTERLIEAFAFISGRIHKKIDDDFPEITESLLGILYPHYINPIPSMSIVKFEPIRQNIPPAGYRIEKKSILYSRPVAGTPCQFQTTYPVMIWPIEVISADLREPVKLVKDSRQVLKLQLKTFNNFKFNQLGCDKLRFYLNGPHQHIFHIYEMLLNNICQIEIESKNNKGITEQFTLAPENIKPVGFGQDESMLPYSTRSFPGYFLLFEYFCFPDKFLFLDLDGLIRARHMNFGDTVDISIYLNKPAEQNMVLHKDVFCLNSTPAVNLFSRIAEPVSVDHQRTEYHVVADIRRREATEIYSIDKVTASLISDPGREREFKPFYSLRHSVYDEESSATLAYWLMQRRSSNRKNDNGTEVFLSFADLSLNTVDPEAEVLTIHATCTNRDLPSRLPFRDPSGDFDMETAAPVSSITCLIKPTPCRRPTLGGALQWRLISHLSLNYLSLIHGGEDALKEMLKLYDFDNSPSNRQQVNGIISLKSEYVTKRIGWAYCRGMRVTVEFDKSKYVGAGLYLFASVLESFLGQYVSVNSFSQMAVKTTQGEEILKEWPPRSGNRILL
jgi:type VI secretion system protein ImpG